MKSKKNKIVFLIFSSLFTKGGHSKNFLNLVKHLEPEIINNGFEASIISYNNEEDIKVQLNSISSHKYLYVYKIRFYKRIFPSGKILFQVLEFLFNLFRTLILLLRIRPHIVYAYSDKTLFLSFPFRYLFRFKLIYDMRGDALNELKVQGASTYYLKAFEKLYKYSLKAVDLIFTVSLKNNFSGSTPVIPKFNYYDGNLFYYDEAEAVKKKKELGLEDKFVFVYTGNAHYYQYIEGTVFFFSQFYKYYPDSFLLIITEYEDEKFTSFLTKFDVPAARYTIISLAHDKVSGIQQIADMSLLLREDLPLNHNSYPTKFAEYLASGVPVLTTPHIHSIAPFVTKNRLGEVVEIQEDYSAVIDSIYKNYFNNYEKKNHCSKFAKEELMWQKKAGDIFNSIIKL